jgi:hypothetical protein
MDQSDYYAPLVVHRDLVPYQEVQKRVGVLLILLTSWGIYLHLSAYNAVGCMGIPTYYKKCTQALTLTE